MSDAYNDIKSSLPLQVALYYNKPYVAIFFVLGFIEIVYKGMKFPFPSSAYGAEMAMLFAYVFVELARLWLASMGNKTEQISPIVWAVAFAVPVVAFNIFNLTSQTYVLRLDQILNVVSLIFVGFEVFFSLITMLTFYRSGRG